MSPLAVGRSFGGLSAPPVICPYRAEQATGLAGGYDYLPHESFPVRAVLCGSGIELSKDSCFGIKFSDVGNLAFESLVRCRDPAIGINHNKTFLISIKSNFSFFRYLYYVVF